MTSHACDACGGWGLDERLEECGCCGCYHYPEFLGDCRSDGDRFPTDDCQVCLGAGRFSDRMPVADALADAETACLNDPVIRFLARESPQAQYMLSHAEDAGAAGYWLGHDAFRAVPGLRGE